MDIEKYIGAWLILVQFQAKEGMDFNKLIGADETDQTEKLKGAWASIIVKAPTIYEAIELVPIGLEEKDFEMVFIDKAENIASLVEDELIESGLLSQVDWLLGTDYIFMISETVFPYAQ